MLDLVAHSPPEVQANGGAISHGYGFEVKLLGPGGIATYGLDRLGSDEPRVLRARVGQSGRTASVFVPRAELDRPPANMRGRPRFPYRGFNFEARVISRRDSRGGQDADFWPQEQEGKAGYVDGRLCEPPCMELLR